MLYMVESPVLLCTWSLEVTHLGMLWELAQQECRGFASMQFGLFTAMGLAFI